MSVVACPYCNAPTDAPETEGTVEVTCAACGKAFIAEFDAPPSNQRPPSRPSTRTMPKPKRAPHPTIVGAGQRPALEDAIDESWRIVRKWASIIILAAFACLLLAAVTRFLGFIWLGIAIVSAFPIWFMLWVMAYVRAIAKHTAP